MKTGRSGGAGGVATTPVMLGVTLPAVVVVAVGLTVAPVGGAKLNNRERALVVNTKHKCRSLKREFQLIN